MGATGLLEKYITGLQIAVDDSSSMGCPQRGQHLVEDSRSLIRFDPSTLSDEDVQRYSLEELHHYIRPAVWELSEAEDVDDAAVSDGVDDLRFHQQPLDQIASFSELGLQHLDCHLLADQRLNRAIDDSHPSRADTLLDDVFADLEVYQGITPSIRDGSGSE